VINNILDGSPHHFQRLFAFLVLAVPVENCRWCYQTQQN